MLDIPVLCFFAYCAGMVDAVVGGGGLIQIPALLGVFQDAAAASLFGTNKLASICGTSVAARRYLGHLNLPWRLVLPAAVSAFVMSFFGASAVSIIPHEWLRPVVLVLVIGMAWYIFHKKDFGAIGQVRHFGLRERTVAVSLGGGIGFYDGLFGPGTGSFLIFLFVRYFSFDFLQASAAAKFVNIATNLAALLYFIPSAHVLYKVAIVMAVFNMAGAYTGAWLATRRGVAFVRILFLCLLVALVVKLLHDMLVPA